MEENAQSETAARKSHTWVWATVVLLAATLLGGFALHRHLLAAAATNVTPDALQTTPTEQSSAAPAEAQTPDPPSAQATATPSASDTADSPSAPDPSPASLNCYNNPMVLLAAKNTAQSRKLFAQGTVDSLDDQGIYVSVGGDDNQYLLFTATPDGENNLIQWAHDSMASPSVRANICLEGFAEVQYIVRDEDMDQTLIASFQTNVAETFRYAQQRVGATPMQ